MALGFRRKIGHQEGDDHRADDGHEDDERSPRAGRREQVGVVVQRELAEEERVVDEPDQVAKEHGAQAGDDADDQRQQRQADQTDR